MKIGIATQPLWGNYGGLLQNYALQQVLRNLGHDPITLDLHSGTTREYYLEALLIRWAVKLHAPRRNSFLPWFPTYAPKRENTTIIRFIKDNIALTRGFWVRYPRTLVKEYGLEALIVGSDQVWRPSNNRRLTDKFFNFARHDNVKRIGYAVSFGSGKWECRNPFTTRKCRSLLQRFDGVSVRERQGLNVVAQLGGQAVQVLDPTLLLGAEGFRQLIANKPASGEKYLGSYILDKQTNKQTNASLTALEHLANQLHLNSVKLLSTNEEGVGPAEWLHLISQSQAFVTDSFHGTVFCLLFHIPFISICNVMRGAERFTSLLEPLNLSHRLVNNLADITPEMLKAPIDWTETDRLLAEQRRQSLQFLTSHLNV